MSHGLNNKPLFLKNKKNKKNRKNMFGFHNVFVMKNTNSKDNFFFFEKQKNDFKFFFLITVSKKQKSNSTQTFLCEKEPGHIFQS